LWLQLNGERREVAEGISLSELVETLKLVPERIAIELNQKVVRRIDWPTVQLNPDDRIEIVHFVGGGSFECGMPISGFGLPLCEIRLVFQHNRCRQSAVSS
jgi:sulfur carrier protein